MIATCKKAWSSINHSILSGKTNVTSGVAQILAIKKQLEQCDLLDASANYYLLNIPAFGFSLQRMLTPYVG